MIDFKAYSPLLKAHIEAATPKSFYHYTSPASLIGVLSNQELWASDTLFLNDASEVKHGLKLALSLIRERMVTEKDDDALSLLTQLERGTKIIDIDKRAYVISFTELEDSLPQWRGYCPASGGYVIGLPAAQVVDMASEQGFELVKCIYGTDLQKKVLNEIIDAAIKRFQKDVLEGDSPESLTTNSHAFFDYLLTVCSTMKHSSFEEEREWRLILLRSDDSEQPLFFREGNKGVIPYCKFKLRSETHPDLITRDGTNLMVRIGPSANVEERGVAVGLMLNYYLKSGAQPEFSSIPYRTW